VHTYLDCIPCFTRQAVDVVRAVTEDPDVHREALRRILRRIGDMDLSQSPPAMGQYIHRVIREITGNADPYREVKETSNRLVLSLYPRLRERVRDSHDPLATAVRLAIAGNIIDFGTRRSVPDDEIARSLDEALESEIDEEAFRAFARAIDGAADILYLGDNAGEIVLDKLLVEHMPREKTTFVVRGSPVINDATRADAVQVGLAEVVDVIDNGSDAPGTILEDCSPDFRDRFRRASLIVAKGQGNFETLNDRNLPIFYLLKVKCPVIARDIGCPVGSALVVDGSRS